MKHSLDTFKDDILMLHLASLPSMGSTVTGIRPGLARLLNVTGSGIFYLRICLDLESTPLVTMQTRILVTASAI